MATVDPDKRREQKRRYQQRRRQRRIAQIADTHFGRERHFDWAPVERYIVNGATPTDVSFANEVDRTTQHIADRLQIDRRNVIRMRNEILTVDMADKIATRLNLHPAELWPQWWEITNPERSSA